MLNLIVKDFFLMRKTMLLGFVYIIVMVLAFSNGGPAMFTASTFAVTFLLIQTPCAHDDKSRAEAMLTSLPIRRATIVNAKYAVVPLYALIAVTEYLLVYGAVKLANLPFVISPVSPENVLGMLAAVVLFASVFYPIFFRFGYMKTRYVNILLFAGLFAAGSALMIALGGDEGLGARGLADAINSQPGWLVACGLLGLLLGITLVSYLISVRFFAKREF